MIKRIKSAVLIMGISSVIAQVVLLRELLVVFYGNELCIGIILAGWLIWEACGAGIIGLIIKKYFHPLPVFVIIQLLLGLLLPLSIIVIKLTRNLLGAGQGEVIGILPVLYVPFIILAPVCLLFGLQFSAGCLLFNKYNDDDEPAAGITRVYSIEAIGWAVGGVLFTYLLAYFLDNFLIALIVSILNILMAFILLTGAKKTVSAVLCLLILAATIGFTASPLRSKLYNYILDKQWSGDYKLETSKDSVFGNITVRERSGQYSFYQSGVLAATSDDILYNEEMVHFSLLRFISVRYALLVGGGISGALDEILKYPAIKKVWYAELDPLIVELGRKYLKPASLKDKKVEVVNTDGRFFIKDLSSHPPLDCIIINVPDPLTAQLNRFYTLEFFRECSKALQPSGILSIGMSSSENYISDELKEFNGSIYKTLKEVFNNVIIIPGDHMFFIASQERYLPVTKEFLSMNLAALSSGTKYISPAYMYYRLNTTRAKFVENILEDNKEIKINSDFHPVTYYHNIALWVSSYHIQAKKLFNWIKNNINTKNIIISISLLMIILLILTRKTGFRKASLVSALSSGFVGMSCHVLLITMFQVFYGYVYTKLGLLTAGYMIGIVLGSRIMAAKDDRTVYRWLEAVLIMMIVYLLTLPLIFSGFSLLRHHILIFVSSQVIFPLLTLVMGFFTGSVFTLVSRIWLDGDRAQNVGLKESGTVYGLDLAGAAIGALFCGVLLIPLIGIVSSCIVLSIIVLATLCLLLIAH